MNELLRALSIGALLCGGATASAAPIFTLSGGVSVTETGNDFLWIDSPVTEDGTLGLSEPGILSIEYIGKEAGFVGTEFWFGSLTHPGGILVATTHSSFIEGQRAESPFPPPGIVRDLAPYTTAPMAIAAGIVPFHFRIPGNADAVVANGDAGPDGSGGLAFWWRTDTGALGDVVYVLLDDGGGFNPGEPSDNDHDDMIVRLTVAPIPEPATSGMVVAVLGLLGVARRRREP